MTRTVNGTGHVPRQRAVGASPARRLGRRRRARRARRRLRRWHRRDRRRRRRRVWDRVAPDVAEPVDDRAKAPSLLPLLCLQPFLRESSVSYAFRGHPQYYLDLDWTKRVSSRGLLRLSQNENALPSLRKQTNGKAADRVTHGSVRVPRDTRRVRYQVPARWIASCLLAIASVLRDASRLFGCGQN